MIIKAQMPINSTGKIVLIILTDRDGCMVNHKRTVSFSFGLIIDMTVESSLTCNLKRPLLDYLYKT